MDRKEIMKLFPEGHNEYSLKNKQHIHNIICHDAYNDVKRNLHNIGNHSAERDNVFNYIHDEVYKYFEANALKRQEDYDKWHEDVCNKVIDKLKNVVSNGMTYGKAQKLLNMSMKHFYCFSDAKEKIDHFNYCHMPIDSYILEWCKRLNIKIEINGKKYLPQTWSNMSRGEYDALEKAIEEGISNCDEYSGLTLLEAEFYIWNEEKIIKAANELISIKESINCIDILKSPLPKEKIETVKDILSCKQES